MSDPGSEDGPADKAGEPAPRPRPQFGEYAPPGWVSPNEQPAPPPAAPPPPAAAVPASRRWDRTLTLVLFALGFVGMIIGVYAGLNLDLVLEQAGIVQGVTPDPPSWTGTAGAAIVISHIVLYVAGVAGGLALLRRGRTAFLAPLAAGVIAAIIYNGLTAAAGIASGLFGALP